MEIENSFESHNELRHGISGKFVNSATSWLHLCSFKVPVFIPRFKVVNVNKTIYTFKRSRRLQIAKFFLAGSEV